MSYQHSAAVKISRDIGSRQDAKTSDNTEDECMVVVANACWSVVSVALLEIL